VVGKPNHLFFCKIKNKFWLFYVLPGSFSHPLWVINAKWVSRFAFFCYLLINIKFYLRYITKSVPVIPQKRCRNQFVGNSWNFGVSKDVNTPTYHLDTKLVEVSEEKLLLVSNKAKVMRQKRNNSKKSLKFPQKVG
jgi:hypothetical protein